MGSSSLIDQRETFGQTDWCVQPIPKISNSFGDSDHGAETIQLQESKEWLLKGVTAVSPSQAPANGTCEWLPQHPVFSEWLSGLYLRALWIEGLPGTQTHKVLLKNDYEGNANLR